MHLAKKYLTDCDLLPKYHLTLLFLFVYGLKQVEIELVNYLAL